MIETRAPIGNVSPESCAGCAGTKKAPIATIFSIYRDVGGHSVGITITLCEECGRDAANAIGFMCIRNGGWSKLEPRKRKTPATKSNRR